MCNIYLDSVKIEKHEPQNDHLLVVTIVTALSLLSSIIGHTHPSCLKLCRFRGWGFDQGDDHRRLNRLLLRLLRTRQPERRHWINTIPDPGRDGKTKTGTFGEHMKGREIEKYISFIKLW